MRTSLILIAALVPNTSFLLSDFIEGIIDSINPWVFIIIEGVLLAFYFINRWIAAQSREFMVGIGYLDVFCERGHGQREKSDDHW
jgi:hypothetical protein